MLSAVANHTSKSGFSRLFELVLVNLVDGKTQKVFFLLSEKHIHGRIFVHRVHKVVHLVTGAEPVAENHGVGDRISRHLIHGGTYEVKMVFQFGERRRVVVARQCFEYASLVLCNGAAVGCNPSDNVEIVVGFGVSDNASAEVGMFGRVANIGQGGDNLFEFGTCVGGVFPNLVCIRSVVNV